MKHNSSFTKVLFVLLLTALFVLACGTGSMGAIATPVSTNTPASTNTPLPTNTATPKPTNTPLPTATEIPPTPTPVSMGTPVSSGEYEVNVMYMRTLETVYLDKQYHWIPAAGNMFIELGIKAKNLKPGSKVSIPWASVYLVEEDGDVHYPNWGEFKPLAGVLEFNPKKLVFRILENPSEQVIFDEVAYVRAIYVVKKLSPTILLFGFGDSPQIKVIVP